MTDPFDRQVGGNHYKQFQIEPAEYIIRNNLPFALGNVVKYVTRYTATGNLADLQKASHYIELQIECELRNATTSDPKEEEGNEDHDRSIYTPEEENSPPKKGTIFHPCPRCGQPVGNGPSAVCNCTRMGSAERRDHTIPAE